MILLEFASNTPSLGYDTGLGAAVTFEELLISEQTEEEVDEKPKCDTESEAEGEAAIGVFQLGGDPP